MTEVEQQARMSASELQLLVQMLNGIGTDMRNGFARVDTKLEQMIPRPEFTAYQEAMALRMAAFELAVQGSVADHAVIRTEAETAETRLEAAIAAVSAKQQTAETDRLREFKSLNMKLWGVLGGAGVTVGTGVLLAFLNSRT